MPRTFVLAMIPFLLMNVVGFWYLFRALANLAQGAPSRFSVLMVGGFAKRMHFTPAGWDLWQRAIWWHSLSIIPPAVIFIIA